LDDVNDDAKGVSRRVEVLTGPGRRRRWSDRQKAVVAAEALGAIVAQVARRWQVSASQVFSWRRAALQMKSGQGPAIGPAFAPIVEATMMPGAPPPMPALARVADIEIDFGGTVVRVANGVDTKTLIAVLRAVRAAAS
jgi:transposase